MRLKITSGGSTREFTPRDTTASIVIGRRHGLDVVLEDPEVSELHLRIDRFLDTWTFTDQMSESGTLHNGTARYSGDLAEGDELKLGGTTIKVVSLAAQVTHPAEVSSVVQRFPAPPATAVPAPNPVTYLPPAPPPTRPSRTVQTRVYQPPSTTVPKPPARRVFIVAVVLAVLALPVWMILMFTPVDSDAPAPVHVAPAQQAETIPEPALRPEPPPEASPEPPPAGPKTRLTREEEQAYRTRIENLATDASRKPEERLAELSQIEVEVAPYKGHTLKYHISRAQLTAGRELSVEMQDRYGEDQTFIYRAREANQFKSAMERVTALGAYLESTEYHKDWAGRHQMLEYVPKTADELKIRSARWVAERISLADEALSRNDYPAVVEALEPVPDNALLEPDEEEALRNELQAHRIARNEQTAGSREPPRPPFNRRTDRLPPAKPSTLLPQGEFSSLRSETRLRQRLEKIVREEDFEPPAGTHFGYPAEIVAYEYGRMMIRVSRPLPGLDDWEYTLAAVWHNQPIRTRGAFYEQLPDLSQNERLAIVMLYFDEALISDALRAACDLWKAHPDVKADLDQLIATKLKMEVPEGGFIERDGRLVAPE
jgi:pSer/pThr/pTyr-binding forkhead associated (FHA) protein